MKITSTLSELSVDIIVLAMNNILEGQYRSLGYSDKNGIVCYSIKGFGRYNACSLIYNVKYDSFKIQLIAKNTLNNNLVLDIQINDTTIIPETIFLSLKSIANPKS